MARKQSKPSRLKFGEGFPAPVDWQTLPDGKAKYQAYLCSREWAERKRPVLERCNGVCERCGDNAVESVHHLTYERKYAERLEDLAAWCKGCHDFTHGHSDVDPVEKKREQLKRAVLKSQPIYNCLEQIHGAMGAPFYDGPEEWSNRVLCPYPGCECENVHFGRPTVRDNDDKILVPMSCEWEHEWEIYFYYRSGTTWMSIENLRENIPPKDAEDDRPQRTKEPSYRPMAGVDLKAVFGSD